MKKITLFSIITSLILLISGCVKDEIYTPDKPTDPGDSLVLLHYWHFNTLSAATTEVTSDFSAFSNAKITYPGTGSGYMDGRTYRVEDPVSNLNLQMGQAPDQGAVLRVRNPANTRELIIDAPTTGYKDIEVAFATVRTSTGASEQEFYYSADQGNTWTLVGSAYTVPELIITEPNGGWVLKTFSFKGTAALDNNAQLLFRVLFVGAGADGATGNNRFDNLTIKGSAL
jgi:hypothetical protein